MCFILALDATSASAAGIFQPLCTAFVTAFAILLKVTESAVLCRADVDLVYGICGIQMESFQCMKVCGVALAMGGVLVMVGGPIIANGAAASVTPLGALLFVGIRRLVRLCDG